MKKDRSVKFIKNYLGNKVGDIVKVANNVAFGLIESGLAKEYKERKTFRKSRVNKMVDKTTKKLRRK